MTRVAWILVVLAATGCVMLVNYLSVERSESVVLEPAKPVVEILANTESATPAAMSKPELQRDTNTKEILPQAITAETISGLAAATLGDEPGARAAAIDGLANVPKSQAMAILQRVLSDGDEYDRQLALNALRTIALDQGDTDGEISNVLRLAIYDGGNEAVAANARILLDDIERDVKKTQ